MRHSFRLLATTLVKKFCPLAGLGIVLGGLAAGSLSAAAVETPTVTQGEEPTVERAPSAMPPITPTVLDVDPGRPGTYTVARADYNLGETAIPLRGTGTERGELIGAIYYPLNKNTPSPLVVFLHGKHQICTDSERNQWPCSAPEKAIPSYLGFDDPAAALASNGYVVVSISANAISSSSSDDGPGQDFGALARAHLVLDTLDLLADANDRTASRLDSSLVGRIDFNHIGLMGHSRGGEGMVRAALLNAERERPFSIRAVMPLAATNFTRMTLPDVPTAVVLPYCDGDAVSLHGQQLIDDSSHAFDDSVLRSSVLIMGANHAYFNSTWTPSVYPVGSKDDWDWGNPGSRSHCSVGEPTRLSDSEQRAVGTAYISGFFRLVLGNESQLLSLFDGSNTSVASAGRADVRVTATHPANNRLDVAAFGDSLPHFEATGSATARACGGFYESSIPPCTTEFDGGTQVPHWDADYVRAPTTPMLAVAWNDADSFVRFRMPERRYDTSAYQYLSVKIAPGDTVSSTIDMTLTFIDGSGQSQSFSAAHYGNALAVLPGARMPLRKVLLQDVLFPVASLTSVNRADIREIRIAPDAQSAPTSVFLSDISFVNTGVGTPRISTRPRVSVTDSTVEEGSSPWNAHAAIRLSKPSTRTISASVSSDPSHPISFAPGETCKIVPMVISGDEQSSTTPSVIRPILVSVTRHATVGDAVGRITVREDDGVVDTEGNLSQSMPPVGTQGDACSEALAQPGTLTADQASVSPGDSVAITSSGFRPGETAVLSLGGHTVDIAAVASTSGVMSFTVVVPASTPAGHTALELTGTGSGYRSRGSVVAIAPINATAQTPNP